jgi:phosphatidylserine/phosphatidylglycerophosphate/cardiolipin synthase-like enzyme
MEDAEYISGLTARRHLKCSKAEFESLVKQGIIQAHRDEEMRWRVSKESVVNYTNRMLSNNEVRLIVNNNHYEEVIQRICLAKSSIKILTGDFKRFRLKPSVEQGDNYNDGTPFIKSLIEKAEKGVTVQILCSRPSKYFAEELENYYQEMESSDNFEYVYCIRNHAKVIIVDDELAYVGSANVTPAGLGQGIISPGNFEAGILANNPELVGSIRDFFAMVWDANSCKGCHRADQCE